MKQLPPTGAKWQMGLAESHGAVLQVTSTNVMLELSIVELEEVRLALTICLAAKNRQCRKHGQSPTPVPSGT
eukprot:7570793-Heterocapsa_arctica.AAC.1